MKSLIYGHRARIGYTCPPVIAEVFPYEFYKVVPEGVTLAITTLAVLKATGDELQTSYDISLQTAREMGAAGVDLMVLGGAPVNMAQGYDKVEDMIRKAEQECGVPVTTSLSAKNHALRRLGAKRIVVVGISGAPDLSSEYLGRAECEVIASAPMPSAPPLNHLGRLSSEASFEVACELVRAHPEADTLYFPCAHRATIDKLESMEEELGVGVLSASSAIIWEALRRCGIREPIQGFGRLFRDPGDG
jgi:maleate cis-trans isomerase